MVDESNIILLGAISIYIHNKIVHFTVSVYKCNCMSVRNLGNTYTKKHGRSQADQMMQ